jgi:hypothetical protein
MRFSHIAATLAVVVSLPAYAQSDATAVLKRAEAAMGDPKTLTFSGSGSQWQFGQAYRAGVPWPKLNVSSYTRAVDYDKGAWREDFVRSRAEPNGGGAVPLTGEQKISQFLSGSYAWNAAGPAPAPAAVLVPHRVHDLWTTPHGFIRAAQRNAAKVEFLSDGGRQVAVVSFTQPGQFSAKGTLGPDYLVEKISSVVPSPVLGDTPVVTTYENYRQHGGIRFPARIRQSAGGHPVLDIEVKDVQPGAAVDIAVPPTVSGFAEGISTEKAADGVFYIAGRSHHSVAIEMKDHIIVVEAPLYDERSGPMLAEAKKLIPGKPVRYVINSHFHFDHAGGLRAAAADGATIVSHPETRAYYEKALSNPNRVSPDLLAKSGKKVKVMAAKDGLVMKDATRAVEIYHIRDSVHAVPFLMVYLPKERLLIETDAYTPLPPNAPPPSPVNANNVNLADNIARLKLSVDRILPLHGRIVPMGELNRTIGR